MILTGKEIEHCVGTGEIVIEPFDPQCCNPNSYNFHLGQTLLVYENTECLETRHANPTREIIIPPEGIVLQPGQLYLGYTVEKMGSSRYAPIIAARSSLGRLGLFIFLNSGLGDIGFMGQWTLELFVIHPLRVRAGDRIGQLMFFESQGELIQYTGKYQGACGPQSSLIHQDIASSSIYKEKP